MRKTYVEKNESKTWERRKKGQGRRIKGEEKEIRRRGE
jgi:hypothetical protein